MSGRCTHLQHISSAWSQKIQKMTVYFTCYNNFSFPLSRWKAHLWPGVRWRGGRGDNSEHPSLVNNAQRSEFMWTLFTWWRHRVREKWIHSGACSAFTMQSSRLLYKLFHEFFCSHSGLPHVLSQPPSRTFTSHCFLFKVHTHKTIQDRFWSSFHFLGQRTCMRAHLHIGLLRYQYRK